MRNNNSAVDIWSHCPCAHGLDSHFHFTFSWVLINNYAPAELCYRMDSVVSKPALSLVSTSSILSTFHRFFFLPFWFISTCFCSSRITHIVCSFAVYKHCIYRSTITWRLCIARDTCAFHCGITKELPTKKNERQTRTSHQLSSTSIVTGIKMQQKATAGWKIEMKKQTNSRSETHTML